MLFSYTLVTTLLFTAALITSLIVGDLKRDIHFVVFIAAFAVWGWLAVIFA